ncbi:carboxypeptidase M32 [Thorsellia anophelis]|uniref:Metal-dependent carboxypeptidase n=1 Tax=Thorsellia anophelis DSM 18579 TaxID=1123402 RepID=A0A1H9ZE62_9GAMM|nr:carboxypeptidase M32 [Thorsellia anophelis]SES79793.1 carboxypeptidase Taq [Thorsellia anophelis DSM 18579]
MVNHAFNEQISEISHLLNIINLLNWDASTGMPEKASENRGKQIGLLSKLAQQRILSKEMKTAVAQLDDNPNLSLIESRSVKAVKNAIAYFDKIPTELVTKQAELCSLAEIAWREGRATNQFSLFEPYLERIVNLKKEIADRVGYVNHPYEVATNEFETGLQVPVLKSLFEQLKARLVPLAKKVHQAPKPNNDFLFRSFPIEKQRAFSHSLASKIGYDFKRGRLDTTTHPFEISMTRDDVRITTRFNPNFLNAGLFGTLHEAGHALYEQNVAPELNQTALTLDLIGLYAVAGTSYGVHESQSRLWENRVGRSFEFWQNHYGLLQETFKGTLDDISLSDFYRAINRSEPSLIRVEADELTYDLHIMLRVEIEMGLMDGSLSVKELPEYWRAKMQEYLGIMPSTDTEGVLQDIHWSKGMIGSFPTYTLGNVMAAQFMQAALKEAPYLDQDLSQAKYDSLLSWLTKNILSHGRTYTPDELLMNVTGRGIDPSDYLTYLEQKFAKLYDL